KKGSTFEFPPNAAFSNEVREQWLSTFRGRVGYARENWLVYATGGAALALANVANSIVAPADGAGPRAGASRTSAIRIGRRRSSASTSDCRTNPISTQRRVRSFRAISVCTSTITSSASGSTTSCRGTCWTVSSSAELQIGPHRHVVGWFFPAAHVLVDARGDEPIGRLRRKEQVVDANPVILLPRARLVIPKCKRAGAVASGANRVEQPEMIKGAEFLPGARQK